MKLQIALRLTFCAALCGCGSLGQPMSPSEFREQVSHSSFATVQSFDAARPYQQVVDTLRKKANECLAVATTSSGTVFQGNTPTRETSHAVYKPTLAATDNKTELAVQIDFGEHVLVQKVPEGGMYILVAEAVPVDAQTTKVTIYRGKLGKAQDIDDAIRSWVKGTGSSCPNLGG